MSDTTTQRSITQWRILDSDDSFAAWLNARSAAGWQLSRPGLVRFGFTRGLPGQYIYRYHALPGLAGSSQRDEYLRLLGGMQADVLKVYEDPVRK